MAKNDSLQEIESTKRIGKTMMYAAWVIVLAMLTWFFQGVEEDRYNPNRDPTTSSSVKVNEVALKRNSYGHYVCSGTINGQEVTFLLDTGATHVAVPEKLAKQLNLSQGQKIRLSTANGHVQAYLTKIDVIRIGSIVVHDVKASINPGLDHSNEILLGMSVLKNIEFTQRGDTLTLRQL
jgi:aspartyl protease family protein